MVKTESPNSNHWFIFWSEDLVISVKENKIRAITATNKTLNNIRKSLFNEYNCRGCPIMGQREVSLSRQSDMQSVWKVVGGLIFSQTEEKKDNWDKLNF